MNGFAILFLIINAIALLALPRRWAPLPFLISASYITLEQQFMLGPFHFTVLRVLVLVGVIRVLARGERFAGGFNGLDRVLLMWGAWLLSSSIFHVPFSAALIYRLGIVYNLLGIYFLIRVFCQSREDLIQFIRITAFLLIPVALEMIMERLTARNLFSVLSDISILPAVRDGGKVRAQGPFGHSILAGSIGAVCLPLIAGIWRQNPRMAKAGIAACLVMVFASASSGPLMSLFFGLLALVLWRWRHRTRAMRFAVVIGYLLLNFVMKAPAYYVLARIDLSGGSTGWHRAELIHTAFAHLNEWWFAGTDYTRHWMPYGVVWNANHIDITNQFLSYGVLGGLPLMILFICALWLAFRYVGQYLNLHEKTPVEERFLAWSLGAGLFVHVVTFIGISFFDQSVVFLCLNLAFIGSLPFISLAAASEEASFTNNSGNSAGGHEFQQAPDNVILPAFSTRI